MLLTACGGETRTLTETEVRPLFLPPGLAVRPNPPEIPESSTLDQRTIGEFIIRQDAALRVCIGSLDAVIEWDQQVREGWAIKEASRDPAQ